MLEKAYFPNKVFFFAFFKFPIQQYKSPSVCCTLDSLYSQWALCLRLPRKALLLLEQLQKGNQPMLLQPIILSTVPVRPRRYALAPIVDRCCTWPLMKDFLLLKANSSPENVCAREPLEEDVGTNPIVYSTLRALVVSDKISATESFISLPRSCVYFQISAGVCHVCLRLETSASSKKPNF